MAQSPDERDLVLDADDSLVILAKKKEKNKKVSGLGKMVA